MAFEVIFAMVFGTICPLTADAKPNILLKYTLLCGFELEVCFAMPQIVSKIVATMLWCFSGLIFIFPFNKFYLFVNSYFQILLFYYCRDLWINHNRISGSR